MMRRLAVAIFSAALSAGIPATFAQDALDWQPELNTRLLLEKGCKVAFYSGVVDRKLADGKRIVIAKAHCDDKRAFDATRNSDYEPFQIKECRPEPTSC